jgi:aspartyl-tRNA(Asn)/glutamyl-tRNA(Gln) amidotransferase subunit A
MGSSTENSGVKKTRNPWNLSRVPGGSSGGSAAAVAAGFVTIALGSDTGGSIRQPASMCGVVGMKPTYGLVSRFGLIAYASSLDQIGPIGRSVEDTAIALTSIAGYDRRDSTSLEYYEQELAGEKIITKGGFDFGQALECDSPSRRIAEGSRIGIIKELIDSGVEQDVSRLIRNAANIFEKLGAKVEEVSVPHFKYALPVYYILATAEASANLARFDGVRYGYRDKESKNILSMYLDSRNQFGAEVKRRIMLGTFVLSSGYYDAYYKKAQAVRHMLKQDFDQIFSQYDLLICPTSPSVAFQFDEKTIDPLKMYLSDIASIPVNLAGLPGISVPCGLGEKNLPVGLQIIGNSLADHKVLQAARAFEQETDFHNYSSSILSGIAV